MATKTLPIDNLDSVKRAYRGLDLEICEDQQAIDAQVKAIRPKVHRASLSTSATDQAWAAQWQRDAAEISPKDKRAKILETIVYPSFKQRSKTSTDAAIELQNNPILTTELAQRFKEVVREHCYVREDLAWQWFQRFCQEEGIKIGEPLGKPCPVEDFKALSGRDKISLSWRLPTKNCDEVEIVREADGATTRNRAAPGTTWSKKVSGDSSYHDDEARAGVWYTYRAFSWYKGTRGDVAGAQRAVRWVEVSNVRHQVSVSQVTLTWDAPPPGAKIKVFKRIGGPPRLRKEDSRGWQPADDETVAHDGQRESWQDKHVEEGARYCYRIVVDFGSGVVSDGVDEVVDVPKRPANVPTLLAKYMPEQGKDRVVLIWTAQAGSRAEYVVVRREGQIAPQSAGDGKTFGPFAQAGHEDTDVVSGCYYTYAVFACIGNLFSLRGATDKPVAIFSDVRNLRASEGDGAVELHWQTPLNVVDVVLRRDPAPRAGAVSVVSKLAGQPGLVQDSDVENGKTYRYFIRCEYKSGSGEVGHSKGISVEATPVAAPEPVRDFRAKAVGPAVNCEWTSPAHGQVVVRRHSQPLEFQPEAMIDTAEVLALGVEVVTSSGKAVDDRPTTSEPYYSVFTVAGNRAVFGGSDCAIVCPDVKGLRLTPVNEGVRLEWDWPSECTAVRIVRRLGAWPTAAKDPGYVAFSNLEYRNAGNQYLDRIHERGGRYHYVVYAQISGSREIFFSAGTGDGCRASVEFSRMMTLRYRLMPEPAWKRSSRGILLAWDVEESLADSPEFALLANESHPPANFADGIEIHRWKPVSQGEARKHCEHVSLERIRQKGWARFFCKAFTVDPQQGRFALVVHPNVCASWSSDGRPPAAARRRPPGYYRPGVPETVICPTCFEEFPLSGMKFTDAQGDIVAGRYGVIDRLLRRPLRPPRDARGRNYTVKLCPNGHQLPFSTGTQNSLVIGVIGARSSGKSHYIASLIDRLQGAAGNDMQAALMPVTDETSDRYRQEFYEPLFVKHLQLPATPRLPPHVPAVQTARSLPNR